MIKISPNFGIKYEKLITKWSNQIQSSKPLPEYPRPQLTRADWINLNGLWEYAISLKNEEHISEYEGNILVPYPVESILSGVCKKLGPKKRLWYKRYFSIPENWKDCNIILHFGAVDWETRVWLNGNELGIHYGGYTPFSFNITEYCKFNDENELIVSVWDPTNKGCQERGKQMLRPFLIFYTPVSGIWQTVWLEKLPKSYISQFRIYPDIDNEKIGIKLKTENIQKNDIIEIEILQSQEKIVSEKYSDFMNLLELNIPEPNLWSPETPFLYDLVLKLKRNDTIIDEVKSYFGMRKISIGKDDEGITRIFLNNRPIFMFGTLDQGYWPDGLYTAPTDEALKYDIEITKKLGFNMIRKHVKIEPARWYYYCDRIGMLVWQDMPNGGRALFLGKKRNEKCKKNYYNELKSMVESLFNFTCIVVWVPFNEGWGQFETEKVVKFIRDIDKTRLIDSASGWHDKKVGDIVDIHKYPGPKMPDLEEERAAVLGEFGGLGLKIEGHIWSKKKHNWAYRKSKDPLKFKTNYENLISKLRPLVKEGLCAAVYTQITDVEGEINGLLTYDREILKIDEHKIRELNNSVIKML
ncbi:MAG: glycoside hydrolase family 2 protein [Candidatus Helarchaeota archaeon]